MSVKLSVSESEQIDRLKAQLERAKKKVKAEKARSETLREKWQGRMAECGILNKQIAKLHEDVRFYERIAKIHESTANTWQKIANMPPLNRADEPPYVLKLREKLKDVRTQFYILEFDYQLCRAQLDRLLEEPTTSADMPSQPAPLYREGRGQWRINYDAN
jgi:hypothetical protein